MIKVIKTVEDALLNGFRIANSTKDIILKNGQELITPLNITETEQIAIKYHCMSFNYNVKDDDAECQAIDFYAISGTYEDSAFMMIYNIKTSEVLKVYMIIRDKNSSKAIMFITVYEKEERK
jgi:hypothetical protein